MKKQLEIILSPENISDKSALYSSAANILKVDLTEIKSVIPRRRSIDARRFQPVYKILCDIYINEKPPADDIKIHYKNVKGDKKVIVVGFGPGGMFASLKLIELGIKPIVIERGKDIQARRRDLREIQQHHNVNPESNYCFGEGGAGTYSDGKLYTRATKRGDVGKILNILVQHGADPDILIDAHPHIGSNKLPKIIKAIRETVLRNGGEINFESKLTDLIIKDNKVLGVIVNGEKEISADSVILATGHSARDVFELLHRKNIKLESKPFAMGVRIEHPQALINEIQYHTKDKHDNLPAASYNISCDVDGRGVYSFCMCPGGIIIPAATAPGEVVVNGMSLSRRDSPFANAGFVVTVEEKDWKNYEDKYPFGGLYLQKEVESLAFKLANNTQSAPAQRVTDFVGKKFSSSLPATSYIPGITPASLHEVLPKFIVSGLQSALFRFDKKMKGYYSEEAVMLAVESRTSSPIRVPRNRDTFMHIEIEGLFPCGEGAGYAGGIVSASIDGENCAEGAVKYITA